MIKKKKKHTKEYLGTINITGKELVFQLEVIAIFILDASFQEDPSAYPSQCHIFKISEDMIRR